MKLKFTLSMKMIFAVFNLISKSRYLGSILPSQNDFISFHWAYLVTERKHLHAIVGMHLDVKAPKQKSLYFNKYRT